MFKLACVLVPGGISWEPPHDVQDRSKPELRPWYVHVGVRASVVGHCIMELPGIQDRSEPEPLGRGIFRLACVPVPEPLDERPVARWSDVDLKLDCRAVHIHRRGLVGAVA